LDAATGDEIWRVVLGAKTFDEFGHGPRATPSVDGDLVVFLGGLGRLTALKTENGGQLWQVDIRETYGTDRPTYGFASSAVIEGGLVMLDIGAGEGRSPIALDRATGKLLWAGGTPGHGKQPGYSSVLPVDLSGERQLVHLAGQELRSVDLDGTENWSFEWPQGESHSMPIFVPPNRIYASGAAPIGAIMVQIAAGDEGYTVEEVWRTHLMRNHFSSSVYHEGHLYGFDNATLKCFDAANGEQKWAKRGLGKGTLIVVEGHLIIVSDRGRLLVAEATPGGFTETGSVQALTGKSWTAPSLANGVLYLRNQTEIVAYDLRPEAGS
jgi:outer membrane protein assembly factor BamB